MLSSLPRDMAVYALFKFGPCLKRQLASLYERYAHAVSLASLRCGLIWVSTAATGPPAVSFQAARYL
jgi:hypothetical protein